MCFATIALPGSCPNTSVARSGRRLVDRQAPPESRASGRPRRAAGQLNAASIRQRPARARYAGHTRRLPARGDAEPDPMLGRARPLFRGRSRPRAVETALEAPAAPRASCQPMRYSRAVSEQSETEMRRARNAAAEQRNAVANSPPSRLDRGARHSPRALTRPAASRATPNCPQDGVSDTDRPRSRRAQPVRGRASLYSIATRLQMSVVKDVGSGGFRRFSAD